MGMRELSARNSHGNSHPKSLTPRQREVVQLLAEGKTMREAANVLSITMRTVAFHKYRVMREFGFRTNADLIRFAMERHIIGIRTN